MRFCFNPQVRASLWAFGWELPHEAVAHQGEGGGGSAEPCWPGNEFMECRQCQQGEVSMQILTLVSSCSADFKSSSKLFVLGTVKLRGLALPFLATGSGNYTQPPSSSFQNRVTCKSHISTRDSKRRSHKPLHSKADRWELPTIPYQSMAIATVLCRVHLEQQGRGDGRGCNTTLGLWCVNM